MTDDEKYFTEPVGADEPDHAREPLPDMPPNEMAVDAVMMIAESCYRQGVVDGANATMAHVKLDKPIPTPDAMWQCSGIRESAAGYACSLVDRILEIAPGTAETSGDGDTPLILSLVKCVEMLLPQAGEVKGLDLGLLNTTLIEARCRIT